MKTPLALVLVALVLVACAPDAPPADACPAGEILLDFGGCCPDADADGICDRVTPATEDNTTQEEILEDIIIRPQKNTTVTVVPVHPDRPLSYTEEAEKTFLNRTQAYAYYVDSPYGELWVRWTPGRRIYIAVENLFSWDNGRLATSNYDYLASSERFVNGVEDRYIKVLNYVYVEESGLSRGCYVQGRDYSLDFCIDDYPNGNPIIYYDFTMVEPESPLEWLHAFDGVEPSEILTNRSYRTTGPQATSLLVDEVTFPYEGGEAKLYLHQLFRAPVQVDILRADGTVKERVVFAEPVFNPTGLPRLAIERT